jgi:hypothetical protein
MDRAGAYALLANRLESARRMGYTPLAQRVNQPPTSDRVQIGDEEIVVEVAVRWANQKRRSLRVEATALGPSTWMTQRLQESIVLEPS